MIKPLFHKPSLRKSLSIGLFIPFFLCALVAVFYGMQVRQLLRLTDWVAHTESVIGETRLAEKLFVDMETGIRGYYLTKDKALLDPYYEAKNRVNAQFEKLKSLVADNTDRSQQIDSLWADGKRWMLSREALLDPSAVVNDESIRAGKNFMDEIRLKFTQLVEAEEVLKATRREKVTSVANNSLWITGIVALAFASLLGLVLFRLVSTTATTYEHALAERDKVSGELQHMNEFLEARVQERTAALAASNKELEAFCYSVSHDLRAPLRGIDGFSKALLEDYQDKLDDEGKQFLYYVREGIQRMGQLIDDLLSLSRLTRAEMTVAPVDLSQIARDIHKRLMRDNPDMNVDFKIEDNLRTEGDRALLGSVLENLFSNAWKFSAKSPKPHVEFGSENREGNQIFYVRDNGAGFDMSFYDKLFGAFQRLHSAREFPGTGVGLATVRRIVHRHGGTIWAEAAPGKGATFYFTLGQEATT